MIAQGSAVFCAGAFGKAGWRIKAVLAGEDGLPQLFDSAAEVYDGWYDEPDGKAIFKAELKCLRALCVKFQGRWLEAGVGSGRFAFNLGVGIGIDPSIPMLGIAKNRGILATAGYAEALPFADHSFDGILLVLALCFMADSDQALRECGRVLQPEGKLVLGVIPADSPWGKAYERKKAERHPIYASARFPIVPRVVEFIKSAGFVYKRAASSLFWDPDGPPDAEPLVTPGFFHDAGFLGLLFEKADNGR